ncbi:uncharacterized protein LOC130980338 [Arachis stenosperma]|uniref:uncharacterized protein LOC130980338 n=1 Tax=Arachis stenosperma TaxID=217475 RepID=UPI0025AD7AAE|nr:uncharacterized protein LOC130980338 [Arachis stenosperma]
MEGWKERLLNQAGKETLIKSVIQAMPSYAMNIIKFFKSFCKRICSKVARFWWATSGKERGIHWKKWDCITDSNSSVGLGFKDLEKHNTTYLAKQAWRAMKNPDAIWVQKACHDILPVGSNLYKRRMAPDLLCQICLKGMETVKHALLLYDWARATWFGVEYQWIPTPETVNSIGSWMVKCIRKIREGGRDDHEKRISKLGFLLWEIWKTRNNKLFQQQEVNQSWTISKARALETVYGKLAKKQQTQKREANRSRTYPMTWRPPPEDWLKANVDAAFRKENETGAIAVVIKDSKEKMVLGFSGKIQAKSSIVAEAQAIRQALIIVNNLNMGKTLIESDSLKLIQTIKSKTTIGEASAIIQDIQNLMEKIPEKGMTWTPRNENRLAMQ